MNHDKIQKWYGYASGIKYITSASNTKYIFITTTGSKALLQGCTCKHAHNLQVLVAQTK